MQQRSSPGSKKNTGSSWLEKFKEREGRDGRASGDEPGDRTLGASRRVVAAFSAKALVGNYRAIRDQVPGQAMIPMIKADAYGHGAAWAARVLGDEKDLYAYGVATFQEGSELREECGSGIARIPVVVFSGAAPWTEAKGDYCERYGLTPVIGTEADWAAFVRQGWPGRIPYQIKFNTGMNRLGLPVSAAAAVSRQLRAFEADARPTVILTHLAMGESPESRLSQQQLERFASLRSELAEATPGTLFSMAASTGIWNSRHFRLSDLTDIVRPGISLYGVPPWDGAPARGIEPVMTLKASVATVLRLKPGEPVGYGGTFVIPQPPREQQTAKGSAKPFTVAVVMAGYADGIHRSLSNQGHVWVKGRAERVVGRVSMDLSAVSCPAETEPGDWVEFIGPRVDAWAQAKVAGTIPYELLTSVAARVHRIYE